MTRRGLTLVEMLVALTASLVIMAAIAQVFSSLGSAISTSRSVLDTDAQIRSVAWRLRSDLAGVTARMLPPLSPESGEGYFEVIEGPAKDANATDGTVVGPADHDDVLLFTTRAMDTPFIGLGPNGVFESSLAEVAWFARPTPGTANPQTYTLYRRQMLVMGYVGVAPFASSGTASFSSWSAYFNQPCDISARREGTVLYPNTLSDLTRRESRFLHNATGLTGTATLPLSFAAGFFPFVFASGSNQASTPPDGLIFDSTSQRQGEDVLLTNVIAFDVRVFDPAAQVLLTAGDTVLVFGDPGFADPTIVKTATATGAYVDLGNSGTTNSLLTGITPHFSGSCQAGSGLRAAVPLLRVYDTWSTHYEADGLNQDGNTINEDKNNNGLLDPGEDLNANGSLDPITDSGTNGRDDNADGQIDEPPYDSDGNGIFEAAGELETCPPYPYPLRGIEVRIRCYEPSSRQVRQVTVRQTFVPN